MHCDLEASTGVHLRADERRTVPP